VYRIFSFLAPWHLPISYCNPFTLEKDIYIYKCQMLFLCVLLKVPFLAI
jgi:hypothetical protein